jgi:hypothetical protein
MRFMAMLLVLFLILMLLLSSVPAESADINTVYLPIALSESWIWRIGEGVRLP